MLQGENVAIDDESAEVFVAPSLTGRRVTAVDQRVDPGDLIQLPGPARRDDRPPAEPRLPTTTSPQGKVTRIRDVNGEVNVAAVHRAAQLRSGSVRDPPVRMELVGEAGI